MIYDKIINADVYQTKYSSLNRALKLLKEFDFSTLDFGITQIDDKIKIVKMKYKELFPRETFGEIHAKNVDIHIYAGECDEIFGYDLNPEYNEQNVLLHKPENDVVFVNYNNKNNYLRLTKGYFALFLPGELHCPLITDKTKREITKIIIKINIEE
ncbi:MULTISPECIES: YhcH/YjgK/YiaL family protein [unclassified Mycoplasma]|uniref:YhcH/YjgK/YiaL family protein n=1 Tax=unclassified Mycoplasma TaxID=2683645 RepID=UPI00197C9CFB|nr:MULTISPECIES: YhcH/YjgK/YiaL family protein [unclassified Mycoplasma]MBN4084680.1 YhcH/YjgK/YiaL family protein [Mycoplasma sp. CSL10166]MBU4693158.1 YhcH/YjgK/YiaL family protein [Mycoplasma sp. CSL7491-lung]